MPGGLATGGGHGQALEFEGQERIKGRFMGHQAPVERSAQVVKDRAPADPSRDKT